jgi:hypothetical protein
MENARTTMGTTMLVLAGTGGAEGVALVSSRGVGEGVAEGGGAE